MVDVTRENLPHEELVIMHVDGRCSVPELVELMVDYNKTKIARKTLWDFRACSLELVTDQGAREVVREVMPRVQKMPGRMTAHVAGDSTFFGLMRMAVSWTEAVDEDIKIKVFYDFDDARKWLDGDGF